MIGPHLRLCVAVDELAEPYVPSERRQCVGCARDVWYDARASIDPTTEVIVCGPCLLAVAPELAGSPLDVDIQQARFLPAALDIIARFWDDWMPNLDIGMWQSFDKDWNVTDQELITDDERAVLALIEERHDG